MTESGFVLASQVDNSPKHPAPIQSYQLGLLKLVIKIE